MFFCKEWRIGDCKISAGQGQARARQQLQSEARTAGQVLHSGTAPQRGGIPVNMREALAGRASLAGREFVCLSWGGIVAVVMGDVRRQSPRPQRRGGGHSTG